MTRAAHCDECKHYDADIVPHEGWPCVEGHKPRFYIPQTMNQEHRGDYGWKRRCEDFERKEA